MMKEIYLISVYDPNGNDGEGHSFFDYKKGAFAHREVADEAVNGMMLFQEMGDECSFSVVTFKFNPESTLEDWLDNNLPGRKERKERRAAT